LSRSGTRKSKRDREGDPFLLKACCAKSVQQITASYFAVINATVVSSIRLLKLKTIAHAILFPPLRGSHPLWLRLT